MVDERMFIVLRILVLMNGGGVMICVCVIVIVILRSLVVCFIDMLIKLWIVVGCKVCRWMC